MPFRCRLLVVLAVILMPIAAGAAGKHASARAKAKAKAEAKAKLAAARACPVLKATKPAPPIVVAGGKVALLAFTGEGAEPIRRQVAHLLRAKGMRVLTNLRPVDSPEQFREMAGALRLVAYVDGEVTVDGREASATVFVRNGASGLRTASATVAAERRQLASGLGKALWERLGPALGDACADAAKPRKGGRAPLRINAGTPLTAADTEESTD